MKTPRRALTPAIPYPPALPFTELTLRDYFAAQAMNGRGYSYQQNEDEVAAWAYRRADAMLNARIRTVATEEE